MATYAPVLPGTPTTKEQSGTQQLLNRIVGLHEIITATDASHAIFDGSDLSPLAREVITNGDLLWNDTDGQLALGDAAKHAITRLHLDIVAYGHNSGSVIDIGAWEIDSHVVRFHRFAGALCRLVVMADDKVFFYFDDGHGVTTPLTLNRDETEALQAFAWIVVV